MNVSRFFDGTFTPSVTRASAAELASIDAEADAMADTLRPLDSRLALEDDLRAFAADLDRSEYDFAANRVRWAADRHSIRDFDSASDVLWGAAMVARRIEGTEHETVMRMLERARGLRDRCFDEFVIKGAKNV